MLARAKEESQMKVNLLGGPLLNVELFNVEEQVKKLFVPLLPIKQVKFVFNPLKYGVAVYERKDMFTFLFTGVLVL